MAQQIIYCHQCGQEVLVEVPGRKVAAVYVTIGYSNGGAVIKLERAMQIVEAAAEQPPYDEDLSRAAHLLQQVACELVTVLED